MSSPSHRPPTSPPTWSTFTGNNKGIDELEAALDWGIGRIVVDNPREMDLIDEMARARRKVQDILIRVSPGVDPHTHSHTTTGILDSKFGIPIETGLAEEAVKQAMSADNLRLVGLHFHLGSPIYEIEPYRTAIDVTMSFAAEMQDRHGLELLEFSPGGGFAIQYTADEPPPEVSEYADAITFCNPRTHPVPAPPPHRARQGHRRPRRCRLIQRRNYKGRAWHPPNTSL